MREAAQSSHQSGEDKEEDSFAAHVPKFLYGSYAKYIVECALLCVGEDLVCV